MRRLALAISLLGALAAAPPAGAGTLAFDAGPCAQRTRECAPAIWVARDDGSGLRQVTRPAAPSPYHDPAAGHYMAPEADAAPSWTLDGRIVFQREKGEFAGSKRLYVVDPSGSDPEAPLGVPGWDGWWSDESPAASPLGTHVAFSSTRPDGETQGKGGGPMRILVAGPEGVRPVSEGLFDERPSFSPDGLRILFVRNVLPGKGAPQGRAGIWATTLLGTPTIPVVAGEDVFGARAASWSRDGLRLAAVVAPAGLIAMKVGSAQVARFGDGWHFHSWGRGSTLYVTREGEPNVLYGLDADAPARAPRQVLALPDGWFLARATWRPDLHEIVDLPEILPPLVGLVGDLLPAAPEVPEPLRVGAIDPDGIRSLQASVARTGPRGRCRFLTARGRLSRARPCTRPLAVSAKSPSRWASLTRRLPAGRYRLRLRATDRTGDRSPRITRTVRIRRR